MALFNPGKVRSILDEPNRGILDEGTQAQQPAYQNAYQAVMGQGPSIGETPEWFQKQRMAFYAPTDIDRNAVDLYTSTSAQAEDWRTQGQSQYQDFTKKYGTDAPWLFRNQSEGGLGLDASQYNLLADPTKEYQFKGDIGSNAYMNSRYGIGDAQSAYLEGNFNPLTGAQGGSFDMFYTAKQGPAPDKGRRGFGSFMDRLLGGSSPANQFTQAAQSGMLGSGIQRTAEGMQRSSPIYETQQNAYNKMYGATPQAAKNAFGSYDSYNQRANQILSMPAGYAGGNLNRNYERAQPAIGAGQTALEYSAPSSQRALNTANTARGYATRFQNPYRRYDEYGY
jgi:hypothetical protein